MFPFTIIGAPNTAQQSEQQWIQQGNGYVPSYLIPPEQQQQSPSDVLSYIPSYSPQPFDGLNQSMQFLSLQNTNNSMESVYNTEQLRQEQMNLKRKLLEEKRRELEITMGLTQEKLSHVKQSSQNSVVVTTSPSTQQQGQQKLLEEEEQKRKIQQEEQEKLKRQFAKQQQTSSNSVKETIVDEEVEIRKQIQNQSSQGYFDSNGKFVDSSFPPNDSSLFAKGKSKNTKLKLKQEYSWRRISDFCNNPQLFINGAEDADVVQGLLGDCYFLSAISVFAQKQELFQKLFIEADPARGRFVVKMYKNTQVQVVIVDDYVPVYKSSGKYLFSHCNDENEIWVPILEKCYAKLHHCYEAIVGGYVGEALADLTGGISDVFYIHTGASNFNYPQNDVQNPVYLWNLLQDFHGSGNVLVGCAPRDTQETKQTGLIPSHAYALLSVHHVQQLHFVKLRNPWSQGEWNGRYSDTSEQDWTPWLKQALRHTAGNDGIFFMLLEDFVQHFNAVYLCYLHPQLSPNQWKRKVFQDQWPDCKQVYPDYRPFFKNPQYILRCSQPTKLFVNLCQQDARLFYDNNLALKDDCIKLVVAKHPNTFSKSHYKVAKIPSTNQTNHYIYPQRELTKVMDCEANVPYIVIPIVDHSIFEWFFMTIYSSCECTVEQACDDPCQLILESQWNPQQWGGKCNDPYFSNQSHIIIPNASLKGDNVLLHYSLQQFSKEEQPIACIIGYVPKHCLRLTNAEEQLQCNSFNFYNWEIVESSGPIQRAYRSDSNLIIIPVCKNRLSTTVHYVLTLTLDSQSSPTLFENVIINKHVT